MLWATSGPCVKPCRQTPLSLKFSSSCHATRRLFTGICLCSRPDMPAPQAKEQENHVDKPSHLRLCFHNHVSFPLNSHMHCPLTMRFLECAPDLRKDGSTVDEADVFYSDPAAWLRTTFPYAESLPTHLVFFNVLEKVGHGSIFQGSQVLVCIFFIETFTIVNLEK